MPQQERNEISDDEILLSFDCGDQDLNEYFQKDALLHKEQLISQTYNLKATERPDLAVALVDLCNDSIRLKKFKEKQPDIPNEKRYPFLPAVKITRLGVAAEFQGLVVGTHLINMLKNLFLTKNRTGCRFLTVEAYNHDDQKGNPREIRGQHT